MEDGGMTVHCCSEPEQRVQCFMTFCEGARSTVVLSLSVSPGLFCRVIAEFAPKVTDTSPPDYFTHYAVVVVFFYRPTLTCFTEKRREALFPLGRAERHSGSEGLHWCVCVCDALLL